MRKEKIFYEPKTQVVRQSYSASIDAFAVSLKIDSFISSLALIRQRSSSCDDIPPLA